MAVQFPKAGCFEKLDIEKFDAENTCKAKEHLPNRFIHYPDWLDEFGRLVKDLRSPQCYDAFKRGEFDSACEECFHAMRPPLYAFFRATMAWDRAHGCLHPSKRKSICQTGLSIILTGMPSLAGG